MNTWEANREVAKQTREAIPSNLISTGGEGGKGGEGEGRGKGRGWEGGRGDYEPLGWDSTCNKVILIITLIWPSQLSCLSSSVSRASAC